MTHANSRRLRNRRAAKVVTILNCGPDPQIDPAPLQALYADLGQQAAAETVYRVLEDLAARLVTLHALRCQCAFSDMVRPARGFAAVATGIGLTEVATAAGHLATACRQGDAVAMEATLSRLERNFDSAVAQVWDLPDSG